MSEIWRRVSASGDAYAHDMEALDPAARARAWRALMHERSLGALRDPDMETLRGTIRGQAFAGGIVARWTLSRQTLVRSAAAAGRLDDEYVFVSAMLAGSGVHEWGGGSIALQAGDFTIVDATRDFTSVTASPSGAKGFLHLKKSALRDRLGARHEMAFGVYKAGPPLQKLAFGFLRDLTGLVGSVGPDTLATLAGQALDVVALLVDERRPGLVEETTHRSAMLFRVKAHIKANLRDPGYGLEAAAAALGMSPRYVNQLLAREDTSFGRLLLASRLAAAHREVVDPRNLHRQVTEIAYDWGFANPSHFGRVFKERFGMTPREAKAAAAVAAIRGAA